MPASLLTSFEAFSITELVSIPSILAGPKGKSMGNVSLWQIYATANAGNKGSSRLATPHKSSKGAILPSSSVEVLQGAKYVASTEP